MRAIGVRAFGPPSSLEYVDDMPEPQVEAPEDIIVAVKAVALNPADTIRAAGWSRLLETVKLPLIIGHTFAGTITAVGSSITHLSPGDSVFGFTKVGGCAASFLRLGPKNQHCLAKLPPSLSFVDAATLSITAITVLESFRSFEGSTGGPGSLKGKTVLVTAGLSGVGSVACQVLKRVYGAGKVIVTVSTRNIGRVNESLGDGIVDQEVDYTLGKAHVLKEIGLATVDVMLDTAFIATGYIQVLKPRTGMILTITGKSGKALKEDWPEIGWWLYVAANLLDRWNKWRASRWSVAFDNVCVKLNDKDVEIMGEWVVGGKVKPVIGRVVKWDDLNGVKAICQLIDDRKGGLGRYVIDLQ